VEEGGLLICGFIFKLEEEGNTALLLHLPASFAEGCVFVSAAFLGCCLVVASAQAALAWFGASAMAFVALSVPPSLI
jgi:hypothetical protein